MKKLSISLAVLAVALAGCKPRVQRVGQSSSAKADAQGGLNANANGPWAATDVGQSSSQLFNLAQYVKENPKLEQLHGLVAEGNAYLAFGEQKLFRAETNLIVDANAPADGKKGIDAAYFLDAYALGKKLPENGRTIDIGASATITTPATLEAHVRIMGDDKFKTSVKGEFEQTFVRDIPFTLPYSPVPGAKLEIGGSIGGEIGLKGALGARLDNAAQLVFTPRVALVTKINGGIKLIELLSAGAEGTVKLVELKLHSSANLGLIPKSEFTYGNIGVEAGELDAIDGKLDLVAGAGYDGILPGGIDKALLTKLVSKLGFGELKELQWRYTLWDPKALIVKDIPGFGKSFMAFYKQPADRNACQEKAASVKTELSGHQVEMQTAAAQLEGLDKKVLESSIASLDEVVANVDAYCNK